MQKVRAAIGLVTKSLVFISGNDSILQDGIQVVIPIIGRFFRFNFSDRMIMRLAFVGVKFFFWLDRFKFLFCKFNLLLFLGW